MRNYRALFVYLVALVLCGVVLGLVGCAKETPVSPSAADATLQFLKHEPRAGLSTEATFYAEQFVTVKEGWKVRIGDEIAGYSSLVISPYALYQDTQIQFTFTSAGEIGSMLSDASFGPHGTKFRRPVFIGISYKDADLDGVDERKLAIYYFDEKDGSWEKVPSWVDVRNKVVYAYVFHFSRYAVALSK